MKNSINQINTCCGNNAGHSETGQKNMSWITGYKDTAAGKIPVVSTNLILKDILGGLKVRWAFGRDNYKIDPGLYCIGSPSQESPVLVTANYKLTFDKLRKELHGIDAWILVLDTKGINVWCAAGKGTFGTDELINRIRVTGLDRIVDTKKIILPQLGAPGVSAHIVKKETGFRVLYGPVRAKDIPYYLRNNFKKTKEMSSVKFNLIDRLAVVPVELVQSFKYLIIAFLVIGVLSAIGSKMISAKIMTDFIPYLGAFIAGIILVPVFLPLIPFRSFSIKGLALGLIWAVIVSVIFKPGVITIISHFLILPPLSAFLAMNYTGASTFTSPAGARLEVKYTFIPSVIAICIGFVLRGVTFFI